MKMHYTKAELADIKKKLGLRWVNRHNRTALCEEGGYGEHYDIDASLVSRKSDGSMVLRYELRASKSDLRLPGGGDKLGTFNEREEAMAFAEWLLPVVQTLREEAKAKRMAEREREIDKLAADQARAKERAAQVAEAIKALEAVGIKAQPSWDKTKLELDPVQAMALALRASMVVAS